MRITQSTITRTLLQSLNRNRENLNELNTTIATGKEVRRSSHDPVQFARAARFRRSIVRNEQYLRNITNASGWVDTTLGIMDSLHSNITGVKEIAIQGADESNDANNRAALANQVDGYIEEVISLANSTYLGKYIFSGTETIGGDEPFTYDGSSVTYNGNSERIIRRIAENQKISININGQQILDTGLFSAIIELRDALNNNDTEAIQSSIAALDSGSESLLALTSGVGSIKNQLTMVGQRLETANINLSSYLSQTEDADLAEVITRYNAEEMAYQAAMQTTTNVLRLNIMDFLR